LPLPEGEAPEDGAAGPPEALALLPPKEKGRKLRGEAAAAAASSRRFCASLLFLDRSFQLRFMTQEGGRGRDSAAETTKRAKQGVLKRNAACSVHGKPLQWGPMGEGEGGGETW
jgi:hypothetical protein